MNHRNRTSCKAISCGRGENLYNLTIRLAGRISFLTLPQPTIHYRQVRNDITEDI